MQYALLRQASQRGLLAALFALRDQESPASAYDLAAELVRAYPDMPGLLLGFAVTAIPLDNIEGKQGMEGALAALDAAFRDQGRQPVAAPYLLARCWNSANRPDLAEKEIDRALQADRSHQASLRLAGNLARAAGEWEKCIRCAASLEKLALDSPEPLLWRLAALPELPGRAGEAATVCQELIRRFPTRPAGYLGMARLQERTRDFSSALTWVERWRKQSPGDPAGVQAQVRTLALAGRVQDAEAAAAAVTDSSLVLAAARGFLEAEAFAQAEAEARRALKLAATIRDDQRQAATVRAELLLGELYLNQGQQADPDSARKPVLDKALAAFQSAYEKEPGNRVAGIQLARLLDKQRGDAEAAMAVLEQVRLGRHSRKLISGDRLSLELLDAMGMVYCDAKRYKEGVVVFHEALKRYPDEPQVLFYLGRCQAGTGQEAVALDLLNRAQSLARARADIDREPKHRAQWLALAEEAERAREKIKK
jgi:tetratricopeptide (TPR) repeat protein